jgi:hypothetical protein
MYIRPTPSGADSQYRRLSLRNFDDESLRLATDSQDLSITNVFL